MAEICAGLSLGLLVLPLFAAGGVATWVIPFAIGHAVLRLTDLPVWHQYSIAISAQVGAIGGAIIVFPTVLLGSLLSGCPGEIQGGMDFVLGWVSLVGAAGIGCGILALHNHPVMELIDAIKTALVGGAVLAGAIAALVLTIFVCVGCSTALYGAMDWTGKIATEVRIRRVAKAAKAAPADAENGAVQKSGEAHA